MPLDSRARLSETTGGTPVCPSGDCFAPRLADRLTSIVHGVIDGFRWALLRGGTVLWWPGLVISVLVTAALCASGIRHFRRMERTFADVV